MALTQKMYLGEVPVIKNYFGEDKIASFGAYQYPPLSIEFLVVGGGGGGGSGEIATNYRGGGGGAGRFVSSSLEIPLETELTISVGSGGNGAANNSSQGSNGNNSTLIYGVTTYTAPGGGGGGSWNNSSTIRRGNNGGSGGGGSGTKFGQTSTGGTALSGTPIAGFGSNGGSVLLSNEKGGASGGGTGYVWIDGITYSVGGSDGSGNSPYFGGGGGGAAGVGGNGKVGMVRVAYLSDRVKGVGGIAYSYGGYIIHYFDTAGSYSFTYTG